MRRACGSAAEILPDRAVMDDNDWRWRNEVRRRPMILIGNINTNRALLEPYANSLSGADGYYPGGEGFALRTICNPSGNGVNVLAIEASTLGGARRGVKTLADRLERWRQGDSLIAPWLLEVHPGGAFATVARDAVEDRSRYQGDHPMVHVARVGLYYLWTGREIFLHAIRKEWAVLQDWLLEGLTRNAPLVMPGDYVLEATMRGLYALNGTGLFPDDEWARLNDAILTGLHEMEGHYWAVYGPGMLKIPPGHEQHLDWGKNRWGGPLGNRHQIFGTAAVHFTARYLKRVGMLDESARQAVDYALSATGQYLDCMAMASNADTDDITSFGAGEEIIRTAFTRSEPDFFRNGNGLLAARRAMVNLNNMGFYAGTGAYEECRMGTFLKTHGVGYPLAAAAYWHRDRGLKGLLDTMPGMAIHTWGHMDLLGVGNYNTNGSLAGDVSLAGDLAGVVVLGMDRYHQEMYAKPPVGPDRVFDKVCFRDGFARGDAYLLLQGYQRVNDWVKDGNSIIQYADLGHVWIVSHSDRITPQDRNSVYCSNGRQSYTPRRCVRLDLAASADGVGASASTLLDHGGADWQRNIFWRRGRYFVVLDRLTAGSDGLYRACCNWRSPYYAELADGCWTVRAGSERMTLQTASPIQQQAWRGELEGALCPFRLRQFRQGQLARGEDLTFLNVLSAAGPDRPGHVEIRPCGDWTVLIEDHFEPVEGDTSRRCLVGIRPPTGQTRFGKLETDAAIWCVEGRRIFLAGATFCRWEDRDLPADGWVDTPRDLSADLEEAWRASRPAPAETPDPGPEDVQSVWNWDEFDKRGDRVDIVWVTASRPPDVGQMEELCDGPRGGTVVTWSPRPNEEVEITVELPATEPLSRIELYGMHVDTPSLRVEFSDDGFDADCRPADLPVSRDAWLGDLFKGDMTSVPVAVLDAGGRPGRWLRFRSNGFAAREILCRCARRQRATIRHSLAADINGDGHAEMIVATDDDQLAAISPQGQTLWRRRFAGRILQIRAHDINADGRDEVCVITLEQKLHVLLGDGQELWSANIWRTPYSIGFYPPDSDGRCRVMVGSFYYYEEYSSDGRLLHSDTGGGSYADLSLPMGGDLNDDGRDDMVIRFQAWAGLGLIDGATWTSRYVYAPCGPGVSMSAQPLPYGRLGVLLVTESSAGLYDMQRLEKVWQHDANPVTDCALADIDADGRDEVLIAKDDGFITAMDLADGSLRACWPVGRTVRGLRVAGKGPSARLIVLTDQDVQIRDLAGRLMERHNLVGRRMEVIGRPETPLVAIVAQDGRVVAIRIPQTG